MIWKEDVFPEKSQLHHNQHYKSMKWATYILLFLFFFSSPLHAQQMYSWTDENGTKHFSDSPPPSNVYNNYKVKEKSSTKRPYTSHYLYRVNDSSPYCGDRRIPLDNKKSDKQKLITALRVKKDESSYKKSLEDRLKSIRPNKKPTKASQQFRSNLITRIDECQCLIAWAENQILGLESVKNQIILEARQAETQYGEIIAACGEKPGPGTYTNQEVLDWADCEKRNLEKRNELLKKKRKATAMENSLLNSL